MWQPTPGMWIEARKSIEQQAEPVSEEELSTLVSSRRARLALVGRYVLTAGQVLLLRAAVQLANFLRRRVETAQEVEAQRRIKPA